MAIRKIRVRNFKSFNDLEVELHNFNVVIGANASGKSNFINIFKFLRDIVDHGLDNAISLQGDIGYLRNVNVGDRESFSIEITSEFKKDARILFKSKGAGFVGVKVSEIVYGFALEFIRAKNGYKITEDKLTISCELLRPGKQKTKKEVLGNGKFGLANIKGELRSEFEIPKDINLVEEDIFPFSRVVKALPEKVLMLETPFMRIPFEVSDMFQDVAIYNFDPKLPKKAIPITGKTELEEDGSNLAIVLKNIIDDKGSRKRFSNLIRDFLPFVESLGVEKFADRSLLVRLKETYSKGKFLPAFLLSDGTIYINALIIALYFGKNPLVIIEEPERSIHPYLMSRIIEMMKEMSERKQIIITTHNPEIVKHSPLEDILFISRDKDGFSIISRPGESEDLNIFMKNEMGIDELYVQNLLEF